MAEADGTDAARDPPFLGAGGACTLNDSFANCSLRIGAKVFRELFVKSPLGARLGIPTVPLSELYSAAAQRVESLGGKLCFRGGVDAIIPDDGGGHGRSIPRMECGRQMPWCWRFRLSRRRSWFRDCRDRLQPMNLIAILSVSSTRRIRRFILWFDRQITDLHHAALLDTKIQWIFHKSRIRSYPEEQGSYVELVIAASNDAAEDGAFGDTR